MLKSLVVKRDLLSFYWTFPPIAVIRKKNGTKWNFSKYPINRFPEIFWRTQKQRQVEVGEEDEELMRYQ